MLASYFVANGVRSATDPQSLVPENEELTRKLVPAVKRLLPEKVGDCVPEDTAKLIRVGGITQIAGGAMLATGIFRRVGAAALVGTMIPHLMHKLQPSEGERFNPKNLLDKDVLVVAALTGATILASQDTQGNPSLTWRAKNQAERVQRASARYAKKMERKANRKEMKAKARALKKQAKNAAASVVERGADIVESVADSVQRATA